MDVFKIVFDSVKVESLLEYACKDGKEIVIDFEGTRRRCRVVTLNRFEAFAFMTSVALNPTQEPAQLEARFKDKNWHVNFLWESGISGVAS